MKDNTYKILNIVILGLFLLTFFFEVYPIILKEQPKHLGNQNIYERIHFTSGLYQLQVKEFGDFLLMNCMFVLFFAGNKIFYGVNKHGNN